MSSSFQYSITIAKTFLNWGKPMVRNITIELAMMNRRIESTPAMVSWLLGANNFLFLRGKTFTNHLVTANISQIQSLVAHLNPEPPRHLWLSLPCSQKLSASLTASVASWSLFADLRSFMEAVIVIKMPCIYNPLHNGLVKHVLRLSFVRLEA